MTPKEFKTKVLDWLKENNIEVKKKVRVYKYRGSLEVRIYNEPMEIQNSRRSVRKSEESSTGYYRGLFSKKISTYTHINEEDFESEDEKNFILKVLKNEL